MFLAPDRGSFECLQHAPLQTGDIPEEDIKTKRQEFLLTEPRNPELKEVCPRKGRKKNEEPDWGLKEKKRALGGQNKDGSPDRRLKINEEKSGKKISVSSIQASNPAPRSSYTTGPVKSDGNTDMTKTQYAPTYDGGSSLSQLSPYSTYASGPVQLSSNSASPQLPSGSFRCGKNCRTCRYIVHGVTTYTFFSTGETRPIRSYLTCDTENLIYMIQCNRCNLQYIGKTKGPLKKRFNPHRCTLDNPQNKSKPTKPAEHFLSSPNHTADDMQLIPIEKNFSDQDFILAAMEAYLMDKGNTIYPHGLNLRKEKFKLFPFIQLMYHFIESILKSLVNPVI